MAQGKDTMLFLSSEVFYAGTRLDIDGTALIILGLLLFLFFVLNAKVFKPFLADVDLREEKTSQARETAAALQEKAEVIYAQHQEAIAQARADAQVARRTLRVEGLEAKEGAVGEASKAATAHYEEASARLEEQFGSARSKALSQVDALAKQIASKVLGRGV
jgi:F0F1-type ATP synthase membrane subunit b/b'